MEHVSSPAAGPAQLEFLLLPNPAPLPGELPPMTRQFDHLIVPAAADPALELEAEPEPEPQPEPEPFGAWLLRQQGRKGWIADLARAAKSDRDFPRRGSPDDVRRRLQQQGADGDAFEALEDAEMAWFELAGVELVGTELDYAA